jgi:hypothetical protein
MGHRVRQATQAMFLILTLMQAALAKIKRVELPACSVGAPLGSTWELVYASRLVDRFGQSHPHRRKPHHLGAFLGIIHALRER